MCKPRYRAAVQKNIFVLASWYTGHLDRWWKSIEKAICILDEIFLTYGFLLTILSSATSYFLLSKQKSFMKCAFVTPFSTNVFSHILYIYQLMRLLLKCFFLLFLSGKKDWVKSGRRERKNFRQNALPIWNYNYKSLLRLLYQFKCTPASFPSEIGVPLPSAFAFQTNPFIWQAFLYMKCIGSLQWESVFLFNTCVVM